MSSMQKFAWFNLAVIAFTLVVVVCLMPFLEHKAFGGLGCLGLIGLGPFILRKTPGRVLTDERDQLIQRRSWILAYSLYWVVFVLSAVFLTAAVYGQDGTVPVSVIQLSVASGFMFLYAVASIAILVQYTVGARDAG